VKKEKLNKCLTKCWWNKEAKVGKKEKIDQLLTLTEQELEVLKYFCTGESYKKMSKELFIAQGTVRGHMRNIYIKLALFGYPTSKRRFIVLNEYCHLRCDPEYLQALEEGVTGIDQEGKALIVIEPDEEPDEERDKDVDDMLEEDSKYWPMIIPIEEAEIIPPGELIPIDDPPEQKPNPFKIGLFIFALIGFAAVAIMVYEFLSGGFGILSTITNRENPQEPVAEQPTQAPAVVQTEPTQAIIQPTNTAIMPTESPTPAPTAPPKPAVLFEDDFEKGLSDAWEVILGKPIIVNGTLSTDQDTWLLVGEPGWKNYSVEFLTDSPYGFFWNGFNVIGVRADSIDNMYAYKWTESETEMFIIKNGDWSEVPQTDIRLYRDELYVVRPFGT
jgi:DNA-binding CsgD family transcriptional regulator